MVSSTFLNKYTADKNWHESNGVLYCEMSENLCEYTLYVYKRLPDICGNLCDVKQNTLGYDTTGFKSIRESLITRVLVDELFSFVQNLPVSNKLITVDNVIVDKHYNFKILDHSDTVFEKCPVSEYIVLYKSLLSLNKKKWYIKREFDFYSTLG